MKLRPPGRSSIRVKLILLMLVATVPLGSLLIYQNLYSISAMHDKVAQSNRDLLSVYLGQIDQSLRYVEYYMNSLTVRNTSILAFDDFADRDEDAYQLAKLDIQNELGNTVPLFAMMDGLFVYSAKRNEFIEALNANTPYQTRLLIHASIRKAVAKGSAAKEAVTWQSPRIGDGYYITRIVQIGDTFLGAWGRADRILLPLERIDLGKGGKALFVSSSGEPMNWGEWIAERGINLRPDFSRYYMSGNREKYLVVGSRSREGGFSLAAVIPDSTIRKGLPTLQGLILWISVFALGLVPLSLLIAQRSVIDPLRRMVEAMRRIQGGNLELRMEADPTSNEFAIVDSTFNSMIARIRDLKIAVYEEQLNAQRAELKQLQLQMKPHFYLNSLNGIYHLAQMREYSLIQEMTQNLVDYFRYMIKTNASFVSLGDELRHVRTYHRIQEMRLAGEHRLSIDAPDEAMTASVPPLLVQTFVENSSKYGIEEDGSLRVSITVSLSATRERLAISIGDGGPGFPEEVLAELKGGTLEPDENGKKVGIWNMRRRLAILYHGQASLRFENTRPGALVKIDIPFTE